VKPCGEGGRSVAGWQFGGCLNDSLDRNIVTQPPYSPPAYPPPGQPGQAYQPAPGGQPYPQQGQPGFGVPPQKPKKPFFKKPWFLVLAAIVVIGVIASAVNGGGKGTDSTAASSSADSSSGADQSSAVSAAPKAEDAKPATPGIGQPAADGKFQFVVQGVDCSTKQIGDSDFGATAQGQFCIVDLTIKNIGNEPQSFLGDNATLLNAEGQKFSADSEAALYLPNSSSLYEDINPGNSLASKVIFDVPAGMTPSGIELHDSAFSGGVTVALK
jgi:Domain of unknown function (DUF4352)